MERSTLRLRRLPPEIRNLIFTFALTCPDPITLHPRTRNSIIIIQSWALRRVHPQLLALTTTCRQLHRETSKMVFALNTFRFISRWWSGVPPVYVLAAFKQQLRAENFALLGTIVLTHWFKDGIEWKNWPTECRTVVCDMWDHAVDVFGADSLRRVRFVIMLPWKMAREEVVIEGKDLRGSWESVLTRLHERTKDLGQEDFWMTSVYNDLVRAKAYMLSSSEQAREA